MLFDVSVDVLTFALNCIVILEEEGIFNAFFILA
jgi:hypothetical protein